jgi:hypothetical protein
VGTTNLFVELVVIGVGAAAWLVLLVLAAFGWAWVPVERAFSSTALVPLVSVVYLLGIVSDRIADTLFERWWVPRLRRERFPEIAAYHDARRDILTRSARLADQLEYGRSRLRICRGWALNAVLTALALDLFLWRRVGGPAAARLALFGTGALLALAWGCWYSWRALTVTEYRKVAEQADYLRRANPDGGAHPSSIVPVNGGAG